MRFNIVLFFVVILFGCTEVKRPSTVDAIPVDTSYTDTIGNKYSADVELFEIARDYNLAKDSIEVLKNTIRIKDLELAKVLAKRDSITKVHIVTKEKLAIAEYKILRIREYNRIAAQGNNLKFLRGWIIRTINK